MKIGIDARCLEGKIRAGVARYLKNLLNIWIDEAVNMDFVLYFARTIPKDFTVSRFMSKLLDHHCIHDQQVVEQIMLPRTAKKDSIDVLFCPQYTAPLLGHFKRVVTLHDISYSTHPEWFRFKERVRLGATSRLAAIKANAILTVSEYSKCQIAKHYAIDPNKIFVIPNAPEARFSRVTNEAVLLKVADKYGLKNPYVLFLGSIFNRRNVPRLIRAFGKIADKVSHDLVIVGENLTYPYEDLDKMAIENGLSNRFIRVGFIDDEDIAPLYTMADVFVYVSSYEGFGLPPIEAMRCGTCVITSNVTSLPEVVGDAGITIDPENEGQLADALLKLLSDKKLREKLVEKGFENERRFSWKRTAKETLKVIKNVAGI